MGAAILIALLLVLPAGAAAAETLHVSISVFPDAESALPGIPGLQAGLQRLFESQFSAQAAMDFRAEPVTTDRGPDPSARVALDVANGRITVTSDLARGGDTRSLLSSVPTNSPAALLSTMAGDLAFLLFSSRGLSALPLSPPPSLTASLSVDTLGTLTGWNPEDLEPVGLSALGDEITICFPHRYLTLGPLFGIAPATIRDLNAQSVGREPLQLSGAIADGAGRVLLLSEREGRIAAVNPRLGTRELRDAPGLTALPARVGERGAVLALSGTSGAPGLNFFTVGAPPRKMGITASYIPAFDRDREGNFWIWDAGERRIRILTAEGREVYSVRPLFSASIMQLPQQLAVADDGSFLLGGSAEVWKFQGSGIPVWRLTRIPGRPGESLPSSFDLGLNPGTGSFVLLDAQSRRLLAFSSSPAGEEARLAALLSRLDSRKPADLREMAGLAGSNGLGLMALQFGDLFARGGGTGVEREAGRAALLREKSSGYAAFADELSRDLLLERADAAYLRASENFRELTAESPDDAAAAGQLQAVLARRREVRAVLSGTSDARVVSVRLVVEQGRDCNSMLTLVVRLRNSGTVPLRDVRAHAFVPGVVSTPSLAALDSIPPGEERDVSVAFGNVDEESVPRSETTPVFVLITAQRGQEGISAAASFAAPVAATAADRSLADTLACRAVAEDTLAASLPLSLLSGAVPDSPRALIDLAGVLNSLGEARRESAASGVGGDQRWEPSEMRAALRGLSPDEGDWTVVTASLAASLGMSAAVLTVGNRPMAVIDTGIPLSAAGTHSDILGTLSREGTLWIPLSGRVPPPGAIPLTWSITDALDLLGAHGATGAGRSDLSQSAVRHNAPIPFPFVVPVSAQRPSLAALRAALDEVAGSSSDNSGVR